MHTLKTKTLDLKGIAWFLAIAFGLAWLIDLPMYLDGRGLNSPWAALIILQNFTPAVATLIVVRWISPLPQIRIATGLRRGVKGTGWGWYYLFALFGIVGFAIAAPFVAALLGMYPLDLANFSGYRAALESLPGGDQLLTLGPILVVVLAGFAFTILYALAITPFTFGEEWGWRGYLLPQLLPLDQRPEGVLVGWRGLLISGAIWGFWHAPLSLLGGTYPLHPVLGVLMYVFLGMIFGTILGWMRLATGSIWPAVLGHAAFDASAGAVYVFSRAGAPLDSAVVGVTGWTGWILPLLFIAFLVVTHRLPVRNLPDVTAQVSPTHTLADAES